MERAITLRPRNLRSGKKQDISVLRSLERDILEDFLRNVSVSRLISPNFGWADVIPSAGPSLIASRTDRRPHASHPACLLMRLTRTNGHVRMPADNESRESMNGNGEHVRSAAWQHEEARR